MRETAKDIAAKILKYDNIKIVSHIDADGICAGSIASMSLKRAGIKHSVMFVKQLDKAVIEQLKNENPPLVWFTDLGSGAIDCMNGFEMVITDHHAPNSTETTPALDVESRTDLLKFSRVMESTKTAYHLNPHLFGKNGATDISGAGVAYLVAKEIDSKNIDLSALAIIGAVGDIQDGNLCRLTGTNREILDDAVKAGIVEPKIDIRFFGKETRPIYKLLQYSNDPSISGLSGEGENCIDFLRDIGIKQKTEEKWRKWSDLDVEEKRTILSELAALMLSKGSNHVAAKRLVGETYYLVKEEAGTELHEAKEFATLLNACGRYGSPEVGYEVCMGNRNEMLKKARKLLQGHREVLVDAMRLLKDIGINEMKHIRYFHAGNKVLDSIAGTLTGMALNSKLVSDDLPLVGFAEMEDGKTIKISTRCHRRLIKNGLDLSIAMKQACEGVGGIGGGHNVAAGGSIPKGKENEFLNLFENIIGKQLGKAEI
ncbi:MAG: DHH family phosphoesterase [Thermoplasmata archaeon]